jgi:hypothetical protein
VQVVRHAALELAVDALLVDLGERGFDEGRGSAAEGHHAHPEEGTGPAPADCGGDAGDIADADAVADRQRQRLEGGESARFRIAVSLELAQHLREQADLEHLGADREVEPHDDGEADDRHPHRIGDILQSGGQVHEHSSVFVVEVIVVRCHSRVL